MIENLLYNTRHCYPTELRTLSITESSSNWNTKVEAICHSLFFNLPLLCSY